MARRRPRLTDVGHDPDYRFSLANERTFLAWIRTALALDAGGLAVIELLPPLRIPGSRTVIGGALVVLGTLVAFNSYRRWEANERALRTDTPLPPSRMPALLAAGISVISVGAAALFIVGR